MSRPHFSLISSRIEILFCDPTDEGYQFPPGDGLVQSENPPASKNDSQFCSTNTPQSFVFRCLGVLNDKQGQLLSVKGSRVSKPFSRLFHAMFKYLLISLKCDRLKIPTESKPRIRHLLPLLPVSSITSPGKQTIPRDQCSL